jgi:cytochrome P450
MTDSHREFFENIDWFRREDCERLPEELAWSRRECPVVHTAFDGGQYVVSRYDDLRTVAEHPDVFSSTMPGVNTVPVPLPPLDLDPPLHRDFRLFLNKYFSRSALLKYLPEMEQLAHSLVDAAVDAGQIEFVTGFAIPFTAGSLARVVLDDDNAERMKHAIDAVTETSIGGPDAYQKVAMIAAEILAERQANPGGRDDVLEALATATVDGGRSLTMEEQLGVVTVLLLGGLDTTRGAIAHIGRFLAEEPGLEQRMRDPGWVKRDLDELLRFTSTVSVMGRLVTQDNDMLGCTLQAGDRLSVHWASGNRDEAKFERPDELVFDRAKNPHIAFGVGIHRCVGQHFARLQLEIAFNVLLSRVGSIRITPGTTVKETIGITPLAPEEMYLSFDPIREPAEVAERASVGP